MVKKAGVPVQVWARRSCQLVSSCQYCRIDAKGSPGESKTRAALWSGEGPFPGTAWGDGPWAPAFRQRGGEGRAAFLAISSTESGSVKHDKNIFRRHHSISTKQAGAAVFASNTPGLEHPVHM